MRVSFARSPTGTFSGIMPAHAPGFVLAQLAGAAAATLAFGWLFEAENGRAGAGATVRQAA